MPQGRTAPSSADPIRVLFVCTHNSARSQIAEALLKRYGGDDFEVFSAGTEVSQVNPYAVRVLGEAGIDWSDARSKSITEFLEQQFDYVITVCDRARATCPVFPGSSNTLHWGLDDPSEVEGSDEEKVAAFRRTETEVSARLRPFIEVALRAAGSTAGDQRSLEPAAESLTWRDNGRRVAARRSALSNAVYAGRVAGRRRRNPRPGACAREVCLSC